MTSPNRDGYGGIVTLKICKLRETAKYVDNYICKCGCEFFREHIKRLDLVRCNKCKVPHQLQLHSWMLEVSLSQLAHSQSVTDAQMVNRPFTLNTTTVAESSQPRRIRTMKNRHQVGQQEILDMVSDCGSITILPKYLPDDHLKSLQSIIKERVKERNMGRTKTFSELYGGSTKDLPKEWTRSLFP